MSQSRHARAAFELARQSSTPGGDWQEPSIDELNAELDRSEAHSHLSVVSDLPDKGGMGAVYRASDRRTGENIALKLLRPDALADEAWVARFDREYPILQPLDHPNIIHVHECGETPAGYRFFTMEFVEGASLEAQFISGHRHSIAEIDRTMDGICAGIGYAHDHEIVHRDIKPANIMIKPNGDPIVIDYGIARNLDPAAPGITLTVTGDAPGTVGYLAPEVKAGGRADTRSDIFSLGVILYRMLTGRVPDVGYRSPSEFGLDSAWDAVAQKALNQEPTERYATPAELAAAVREIAGRATPPSTVATTTRTPVIEVTPDALTINGYDFTFCNNIEQFAAVLGKPRVTTGSLSSASYPAILYHWDDLGITAYVAEGWTRIQSINVWIDTASPGVGAENEEKFVDSGFAFAFVPPIKAFQGRLTVGKDEVEYGTELNSLKTVFGDKGSSGCIGGESGGKGTHLVSPTPLLSRISEKGFKQKGEDLNGVMVIGRDVPARNGKVACVSIIPVTSHLGVESGSFKLYRKGAWLCCSQYDKKKMLVEESGLSIRADEIPLMKFPWNADVVNGQCLILTNQRLLVRLKLLKRLESAIKNERACSWISCPLRDRPTLEYCNSRFRSPWIYLRNYLVSGIGLPMCVAFVVGLFVSMVGSILKFSDEKLMIGATTAAACVFVVGLVMILRIKQGPFHCLFRLIVAWVGRKSMDTTLRHCGEEKWLHVILCSAAAGSLSGGLRKWLSPGWLGHFPRRELSTRELESRELESKRKLEYFFHWVQLLSLEGGGRQFVTKGLSEEPDSASAKAEKWKT